jgi:hypothetical protein
VPSSMDSEDDAYSSNRFDDPVFVRDPDLTHK